MKKTVTVLLGAALCVAAASCAEGPQKRNDRMETKNSLTEQEKAAGILTAEVMWKMGRVGGSVLSPDGRTVLYTVTRYDMEQNKGTTDIWSVPAGGGKAVRVTDPGNNESSVQWSADGKKIYFLSDRTGSGQVWSAAPSGNNLVRYRLLPSARLITNSRSLSDSLPGRSMLVKAIIESSGEKTGYLS